MLEGQLQTAHAAAAEAKQQQQQSNTAAANDRSAASASAEDAAAATEAPDTAQQVSLHARGNRKTLEYLTHDQLHCSPE